MSRKAVIFASAVVIMVAAVVAWRIGSNTANAPTNTNSVMYTTNTDNLNVANANLTPTTNTAVPDTTTNIPPTTANTNSATPDIAVVAPMDGFFSRVTKKPFGIYITPETSPIQPEKFTGYHTGADAETTAAEATVDIQIRAIASGTVVFAGHVNGYGGVIIIKHTIDGEKILSLYGHLRISSFQVKVGTTVSPKQPLAVLGTGDSSETDGERKHLHFGLIRGWTINYKGYVTSQAALDDWYDPAAWLENKGA